MKFLACAGSWDFDSSFQKAFVKHFGKGKEWVYVDMHAKLTELGLVDHFPPSTWPATSAVRELATKLKAIHKTGQENAFVCAELKKCV